MMNHDLNLIDISVLIHIQIGIFFAALLMQDGKIHPANPDNSENANTN